MTAPERCFPRRPARSYPSRRSVASAVAARLPLAVAACPSRLDSLIRGMGDAEACRRLLQLDRVAASPPPWLAPRLAVELGEATAIARLSQPLALA